MLLSLAKASHEIAFRCLVTKYYVFWLQWYGPFVNMGRFPFDQIFRFEIPGIQCDEWNSIFRFVGLTNGHQSQVIRFQVSRENTSSNGGLFYLCLLALGLLDDSEVEINDVLGEGDSISFILEP